MPIEKACQATGITKQTYYNWIELGKKNASPEYHDFWCMASDAEIEWQTNALTSIKRAYTEGGDWRAAAWMLARRDPRHWGTMARSEDKPISSGIDLTKLDKNQLNSLLEILDKVRPNSEDKPNNGS